VGNGLDGLLAIGTDPWADQCGERWQTKQPGQGTGLRKLSLSCLSEEIRVTPRARALTHHHSFTLLVSPEQHSLHWYCHTLALMDGISTGYQFLPNPFFFSSVPTRAVLGRAITKPSSALVQSIRRRIFQIQLVFFFSDFYSELQRRLGPPSVRSFL
jgi:hypothetical protein